jgi:site-specific recombinase XerD
MAKFNLFLREPNSSSLTPIVLLVREKEFKVKVPTGETILAKQWNQPKQEIRQSYPEYASKNKILKNLISKCSEVLDSYKLENNRFPNPVEFRNLINDTKPSAGSSSNEPELFSFISSYIDERKNGIVDSKPIAKGTLQAYQQAERDLKLYKEKHQKNYPLTFNSIDYNFSVIYKKYLVSDRKYSLNTVGKHIKTLKTFFNEAQKRNLMPNFQSKWMVVDTEQTNSIYLSDSEIETFLKLDLSKIEKLERVRDMFVIGCHTGLRISDLKRLNEISINQDTKIIKVKIQKTGSEIPIPLHPVVRQLFEKYSYQLPKSISDQNFNNYLKEIGKLVETDEVFLKEYTKAGKKFSFKMDKYKALSTHTARRSFATNGYNKGIPIALLKAITGHKKETDFLRYIKATPDDLATQVFDLWENETKSKTHTL